MLTPSMPHAFQTRISDQLGAESPRFWEVLSLPPTLAVRLNRRKPSDRFADDAGVPWCPTARYLAERPLFALDPLWHAGAYYVQEPASLLLDFVLRTLYPGPSPQRTLDLCAAPGGKTTLLTDFLPDDALLVANEVIRTREPILRENVIRWGSLNVMVTNHDPADFAPLADFFDLVVVDAPCSGEGLFRKEPEATKEWSERAAELCAARQQRILENALPLVRPGGHLIYSTCTYNPAENDEVIAVVLQDDDWEVVPLTMPTDWGMQGTTFGVQCWPHRCHGEGFYLSVLRRRGEVSRLVTPNAPSASITPVEQQATEALLEDATPCRFRRNVRSGEIIGVPTALFNDVAYMAQVLGRHHMGVPVGVQKGKDFVPTHALALSTIGKATMPTVAVNLETALAYLRKQDISLPETVPPGWTRIAFEGLPLGWVKVIPGRINNYLPAEWRLRML